MSQAPSPERKVPLGQPIVWGDAMLDALAEISDADLLLAIELWRRDTALSGLRDLLDADMDTGTSGSRRRYL